MAAVLPRVLELARGPNFAAFTVLLRSGQPMTHVMWVDAGEDHVLINTEVHRAKFKAVEIVRGPEARAHIDTLSRKYLGRDYDPAIIRSERVILRIEPDVQHAR